jgi:AraC-like DNA-binding protein/mannose-6-phosphate isomerase-like protein (cupin superfamily)
MKRTSIPNQTAKTTQAIGESTTRPSFIAEQVSQCRYFFFEPTPRAVNTLALPCGGWERCAPNYMVHRNSFEYFALEYVAEGHGDFICNGNITELKPGILFGYAPGSAHRIRTSADRPLLKYFLDFTGRRARSRFQELPFNESNAAWMRQPHGVHDLFQQIVDAGQQPQELSRKLCSSLFEVLLLRIEQNAMHPEEERSLAYKTYARASHELNASFRALHSTANLADKLNITPAYLARLFQRYSNTSPHNTLTSMKMTEAASLLVGTAATVAQVAEQVGFSDPYHFSRVFKNHFGSAPAHFRAHPRSFERSNKLD